MKGLSKDDKYKFVAYAIASILGDWEMVPFAAPVQPEKIRTGIAEIQSRMGLGLLRNFHLEFLGMVLVKSGFAVQKAHWPDSVFDALESYKKALVEPQPAPVELVTPDMGNGC